MEEDSLINELEDFTARSLLEARLSSVEEIIRELREKEAKGPSLLRTLERMGEEIKEDLET